MHEPFTDSEGFRRDALTLPIRELIERYPAAMPVLAAHGMDLCCGGGHSVPEAAALHGLDLDALLGQLATALKTPVAR